MRLLTMSYLPSFADRDRIDAGLEQGQVEGLWEGSGDSFAVGGGPVVHYVRTFVRKLSPDASLTILTGFGSTTTS